MVDVRFCSIKGVVDRLSREDASHGPPHWRVVHVAGPAIVVPIRPTRAAFGAHVIRCHAGQCPRATLAFSVIRILRRTKASSNLIVVASRATARFRQTTRSPFPLGRVTASKIASGAETLLLRFTYRLSISPILWPILISSRAQGWAQLSMPMRHGLNPTDPCDALPLPCIA